jgi:hypothetical protein
MNEENTLLRKKVTINEVTGQIEIPNGNNPFQNAWSTLTHGYDLKFLDSRVPGMTKNVKPLYRRTKLDKPDPAFSELACDYFYVEAQNRLKETFHEAVKQSETEWKDQEIIVPHKGSSGRFDPIEESLYWLIFAAALAAILLCVLAL